MGRGRKGEEGGGKVGGGRREERGEEGGGRGGRDREDMTQLTSVILTNESTWSDAPEVPRGVGYVPYLDRDVYLFRRWNILRMPLWSFLVFSAYRYYNIPVFYAFHVQYSTHNSDKVVFSAS